VPVEEVLIVAGLQVPLIPLFELFGREGAVEFRHNGPIWVNVGVTNGSMTISIVAVLAHWPAEGVKV
jgi:hypothetical protein